MNIAKHNSKTAWQPAPEQNSNGNGTMLRFTDFMGRGSSQVEKAFGECLDAVIDANAQGDMCLDFANVRYVYAADIGRVVVAWKRLKDANRRLVLCNVNAFVSEMFHITRLHELVEIRKTPRFFDGMIEPRAGGTPYRAKNSNTVPGTMSQ